MSELHDAIRFLADHVFRDQSADSVAKRAALEEILSPGESAAPPSMTATEESVPAPGAGQSNVAPDDASPADAPVNPQVI